MNEEMQDLTADTLGKVLEYVEATEGFVIEQAPLLCQEMLAWGFWGHIAGACAMAFLLCGLLATAIVVMRHIDHNESDGTPEFVVCVVWFLTTMLSVGFMVECFYYVLKICVAPRLYIIEELSKLL